MKIFFRVDSSVQIGTGHVMRCLTLADALRQRGAEVSFISRDLPGNICDVVAQRDFTVFRLPPPEPGSLPEQQDLYARWLSVDKGVDAAQTSALVAGEGGCDWLVVDHYALDHWWEEVLRPVAPKIMAIDDIANRRHDCDLLLDQNLYFDMEARYQGLTPQQCRKFLGPRYALLRPEFYAARTRLRERDGIVKRIMIFFGGSDADDVTTKALEAWRQVDRADIAVDVVVGAANPHRDRVQALCAALPNVSYHCNIGNMAEMMVDADLALGGGGSTTWERCFLALPSVTVILAENQAETTEAVARTGATLNVGWSRDVTAEDLAATMQTLLDHPATLRSMASGAFWLMGESAGSAAVASAMLEEYDDEP